MESVISLIDNTALAKAAKYYSSMNLECPQCGSNSRNSFAFHWDVRKFQIPLTVCTACNADIKRFEDQRVFLGSHDKIMEYEDWLYAESRKLIKQGKKRITAEDRKHDSKLIQRLIREL
jgi:predicted RNA-binding Zn-ribbon protein involved in translation (DUF1610 family)